MTMLINIDEVLQHWDDYTIDDSKLCVIQYTKELLHRFLGNLGYGKQYSKELDSLKQKWNLQYDSLEIIYQSKFYTIGFSEKSNTHGKMKGFKEYTLSYDRPKEESITAFDIIVDLHWILDIDDTFIDTNLKRISSSFNANYLNEISSRPFLESSYTNQWKNSFSYFMYLYFIGLQDKEECEELKRLRNTLNNKGYTVEFNIIEESKENAKYKKGALEFELSIKPINDSNTILGYQLFFYYLYKEFWKYCKETSIEWAIKHWYKRDVTLTIYYIGDNLND